MTLHRIVIVTSEGDFVFNSQNVVVKGQLSIEILDGETRLAFIKPPIK